MIVRIDLAPQDIARLEVDELVGASADRSTTIWAEPESNALVITAPAKIMRSLMSVVDKLDIRRSQVLVEAIIVDVQMDKSAELGVNWAVWQHEDSDIPLGTFQSPIVARPVAAAISNEPASAAVRITGSTGSLIGWPLIRIGSPASSPSLSGFSARNDP